MDNDGPPGRSPTFGGCHARIPEADGPYPGRIRVTSEPRSWETQAVRRLRRRDIDLKAGQIRAHGSKTTHRNRTCRITEAWAIPFIADYVRDFLPDALLFAFNERTARDHHLGASRVAKLSPSTLHDHRHSYSVNALRRGVPLHIVAAQLGHANTTLVQQRYGRFVPTDADYARWVAADTSVQIAIGG